MVHHWKGLDLEITDFNYTISGEIIPSQSSRHVLLSYYFIM